MTKNEIEDVITCLIKHIRPSGELEHFRFWEIKRFQSYIDLKPKVEPDIEKVLKAMTLCGLGHPVYADKEEISFRQWLFIRFGMTVEQFYSSTTAYGKKFFHEQYLKYLSERNAITTGKATGVEE